MCMLTLGSTRYQPSCSSVVPSLPSRYERARRMKVREYSAGGSHSKFGGKQQQQRMLMNYVITVQVLKLFMATPAESEWQDIMYKS